MSDIEDKVVNYSLTRREIKDFLYMNMYYVVNLRDISLDKYLFIFQDVFNEFKSIIEKKEIKK